VMARRQSRGSTDRDEAVAVERAAM
jgi:hypothetical protein